MSPDTIATLGAAAVIVAFLWNLHRDVAGLRERMARGWRATWRFSSGS